LSGKRGSTGGGANLMETAGGEKGSLGPRDARDQAPVETKEFVVLRGKRGTWEERRRGNGGNEKGEILAAYEFGTR